MKVMLPIFHHSDNTKGLSDMGMDYYYSQCDVKPIIFYHIDAISEKIDNGEHYTLIHVNNSEYTCSLPMSEVEKILDGNHSPILNYKPKYR